MLKLHIDPARDANGYITIRYADGTEHGNTDAQPVATVYTMENAEVIVNSWNNRLTLKVIGDYPAKPVKMTVEQYIAKFRNKESDDARDPEINDNCLQDRACPKCGSRGSFDIQCTTTMDVSDEGTDHHADTEWDENSCIDCQECNHSGTVGEFTIDGLDEALAGLEDV